MDPHDAETRDTATLVSPVDSLFLKHYNNIYALIWIKKLEYYEKLNLVEWPYPCNSNSLGACKALVSGKYTNKARPDIIVDISNLNNTIGLLCCTALIKAVMSSQSLHGYCNNLCKRRISALIMELKNKVCNTTVCQTYRKQKMVGDEGPASLKSESIGKRQGK